MANVKNSVDHVVVFPGVDTTHASNLITVTNDCQRIEIRQLPSETQEIWEIKHRTDGGGETVEEIPSGGVLVKGGGIHLQGLQYQFEAGDGIGYAAATTGPITLQVKEFER